MSNYFCGWYFKCQSPSHTVALIPAVHKEGRKKSCSIQLITEDGSYFASFPYGTLKFAKKRRGVKINRNIFCEKGIKLDIRQKDFTAAGTLRFGPFSLEKGDVMGPFRFLPGMECRHSVYSMLHSVRGRLTINGKDYLFHNGLGYAEGDRGHSFPQGYSWTQSFWEKNSLMFCAARIPVGPFCFTGTLGEILWQGRRYRFATYLGARVIKRTGGELVIRQGNLTLRAVVLNQNSNPLRAPKKGRMERIVHESPSCRVYYSLKEGKKKLFSFKTDQASFEYER